MTTRTRLDAWVLAAEGSIAMGIMLVALAGTFLGHGPGHEGRRARPAHDEHERVAAFDDGPGGPRLPPDWPGPAGQPPDWHPERKRRAAHRAARPDGSGRRPVPRRAGDLSRRRDHSRRHRRPGSRCAGDGSADVVTVLAADGTFDSVPLRAIAADGSSIIVALPPIPGASTSPTAAATTSRSATCSCCRATASARCSTCRPSTAPLRRSASPPETHSSSTSSIQRMAGR